MRRSYISVLAPEPYRQAIKHAADMEGMPVSSYLRHLINADLRAKGMLPAVSWMSRTRKGNAENTHDASDGHVAHAAG